MDRNAEGERTHPGQKGTRVVPLPCVHLKLQMHFREHTAKGHGRAGPINVRSPAVFLTPSYPISPGTAMLNNCIAYAFLTAKH